MATDFKYSPERRYLKPFAPFSRQNTCPVPLGLRRSVSLEDTSNEKNFNSLQKSQTQNSSITASLKSLCVRLRPYQLLPEFNENIAKSDDEHQFDWWNTAEHLRPLIENLILSEQLTNHFEDDHDIEDQYFDQFQRSKRNGRRNAVCYAIDRLCYNEQMILFVALTNEVQIEYNLMSCGFKM